MITTSPLASTATPRALSYLDPPKRLDHRCVLAAEYFATNTSGPPALVSGPPPKLTVPQKYPATTTLPSGPAATPWAIATSPQFGPPRSRCHTNCPVAAPATVITAVSLLCAPELSVTVSVAV